MNNCSLLRWVATTVPFPGRARPMASLRQFMELAVNMPEQEPQVGHAACSTRRTCSSLMVSSADSTMASIKSQQRSRIAPTDDDSGHRPDRGSGHSLRPALPDRHAR